MIRCTQIIFNTKNRSQKITSLRFLHLFSVMIISFSHPTFSYQLSFAKLHSAPIDTIKKIYQKFGYEFSHNVRQNVDQYLKEVGLSPLLNPSHYSSLLFILPLACSQLDLPIQHNLQVPRKPKVPDSIVAHQERKAEKKWFFEQSKTAHLICKNFRYK